MLAMLNPPLVPRPPCTFPKTAEDDAVFRTTLRVPTTTLSIEQYPQIDGAADKKAITVTLVAPGIKPADIDITFHDDDNVLRVRGKSTTAHATNAVDYVTRLNGKKVDASGAFASVVDGVVTVTLPKKAVAPSSLIEVSTVPDEKACSSTDYDLTLTAAGFAASDVTVEQRDGLLRIQGESKRLKRKLERVYQLPRDSNATGATASMTDGLLTIRIPKAPKRSAVRIPVARNTPEAAPDCCEEAVMIT